MDEMPVFAFFMLHGMKVIALCSRLQDNPVGLGLLSDL